MFLTETNTSVLAQHVQATASVIEHLLIILQIFMIPDSKIRERSSNTTLTLHTVIYYALHIMLASDYPP